MKQYPSIKTHFQLKALKAGELKAGKIHYNKSMSGLLAEEKGATYLRNSEQSIAVAVVGTGLAAVLGATVRIRQPEVDQAGAIVVRFKEDVELPIAECGSEQQAVALAKRLTQDKNSRGVVEVLTRLKQPGVEASKLLQAALMQLGYTDRAFELGQLLLKLGESPEACFKPLAHAVIQWRRVDLIRKIRLHLKQGPTANLLDFAVADIEGQFKGNLQSIVTNLLKTRSYKCRNYMSNKLVQKKCAAKEKGCGLFAEKDLEEGQVLLVERAYVKEQGKGQSLADMVFQRLYARPGEAQRLYWLGLKENSSKLPQTRPKQFNSRFQMEHIAQAIKANLIDVTALDCIVDPSIADCKGLWLDGSLLNHSCAPNCESFVLFDLLVVRAQRRIQAGEEVQISYLSTSLSHKERSKELSLLGIEKCLCWACEEHSKLSEKESERGLYLSRIIQDFLNELQRQLRSTTSNTKGYEIRLSQVTKELRAISEANINLVLFRNYLYFMRVVYLLKLGRVDRALPAFREFVEESRYEDTVNLLLFFIECLEFMRQVKELPAQSLREAAGQVAGRFGGLGFSQANIGLVVELSSRQKAQVQRLVHQKITL